jgi:hypothetical protein
MTEFAFNVIILIFTWLFVFMTNYEFESRIFFDSFTKNNDKLIKKRILMRKALNIIHKMTEIWKFIKKTLANAQENQK